MEFEKRETEHSVISDFRQDLLFLKQEMSQLREEIHKIREHKIKAIFLLAGSGTRLKPLTDNLPKCLLEINGVSILNRALDILVDTNKIDEIILVVGFEKNKIKDSIGDNYRGIKVTYVDNDDYDKTNNVYSLWLARQHLDTDFILLEGDVIFDPQIANKLLSGRISKAAVSKFDPELMNGAIVSINNLEKTINFFISKEIQKQENISHLDKYKTINLYYFTKEFFEKYFRPLLSFYIENIGKNIFYESVLGALSYFKIPIYAEVIDEKIPWFEIDTAEDLEIATRMFSKSF